MIASVSTDISMVVVQGAGRRREEPRGRAKWQC
jgi:hypothetical protein